MCARPALRLGTRASTLARRQSEEIADRLRGLGHACELVSIRTTGDAQTTGPLRAIGGKGLFTKELEEAMLDGRIDFAVHSLKDMPARLPEGLILAAIPEREDARDAWVAAPGTSWRTLPDGSRVGTGSLRRAAQLRALRPELRILALRGNVDTRLRKWREGEFDGLVLAAAGLKRLGLEAAIAELFEPSEMLPAVGQGALGLECRLGDAATRAVLERLNHAPSAAATAAERAWLARLNCGCDAPVAAQASYDGAGRLRLEALVATTDGSQLLRAAAAAEPGETPAALGSRVADQHYANGAGALLAGLA